MWEEKAAETTETSESNRSPAALGGSLGQRRTLEHTTFLKCARAVVGALGKWGIPPFAQVASRYPMALAASEVLSFAKTSFQLCQTSLSAVPTGLYS